jgi:hypothetical protein
LVGLRGKAHAFYIGGLEKLREAAFEIRRILRAKLEKTFSLTALFIQDAQAHRGFGLRENIRLVINALHNLTPCLGACRGNRKRNGNKGCERKARRTGKK